MKIYKFKAGDIVTLRTSCSDVPAGVKIKLVLAGDEGDLKARYSIGKYCTCRDNWELVSKQTLEDRYANV